MVTWISFTHLVWFHVSKWYPCYITFPLKGLNTNLYGPNYKPHIPFIIPALAGLRREIYMDNLTIYLDFPGFLMSSHWLCSLSQSSYLLRQVGFWKRLWPSTSPISILVLTGIFLFLKKIIIRKTTSKQHLETQSQVIATPWVQLQ